jgi:Mn-dependent DtxR family transcriptional regulator
MVSMGRDYEAEQRERKSFILLQHVYTITEADPGRTVVGSTIARDLGFGESEARELIEHLGGLGYFEMHSDRELGMSTKAIEYIERLAWRRHSVRPEQ